MAHVAELLDQLAAGTLTADQVAADFRARIWPASSRVSADDAQVGADPPVYGPDSWDVVNADSRLTPEVYQRLAAAYAQATRS